MMEKVRENRNKNMRKYEKKEEKLEEINNERIKLILQAKEHKTLFC